MGHLVLARKRGESIIITAPDGTRLVVAVEDIRDCGSKVQIGVTAPEAYRVHRSEIQDQIDRERAAERGRA